MNTSKVPLLKGVPTINELHNAIKNKKILFLGIPLAANSNHKICQLDCRYCFVQMEKRSKLLGLKDHFKIIDEFEDMGGKYIKTATVGEPFLDKFFYNPKGKAHSNEPEVSKYPLIDHSNKHGIYWTSFTNMVCITPLIAKELFSRKVSIIGKLNSMNPDTQELLTGETGFFARKNWTKFNGWIIPEYLKYLIDAGFNKKITENRKLVTRLGVDVIVTKKNIYDIPYVVKFCVQNNIYPNIETLEISGKAKYNLDELQINNKENKWLYNRLIKLVGHNFLTEERQCTSDICPIFTAGLVYNIDGSLRYCYNVDSDLKMNIKDTSLGEIYQRMLKEKSRIMNKIDSKKVKGILNPCPVGDYRIKPY